MAGAAQFSTTSPDYTSLERGQERVSAHPKKETSSFKDIFCYTIRNFEPVDLKVKNDAWSGLACSGGILLVMNSFLTFFKADAAGQALGLPPAVGGTLACTVKNAAALSLFCCAVKKNN
ncbi:hypothetical protein D5018_15235 [Parashewanella curva]|uniref:Uncharacterized protein n=1 Tax=Parashewanella curva TaxID=2338552 RepID=A0A3L8PU72_9GAMM|nr:hypothetical protein [Parashewanella curva]RLV58854.1 hypothetical protein D5018_15235 [Parashewanella curva]